NEIRERLQDGHILVVERFRGVRSTGEDPDELSATLHWQAHLTRCAEWLAALDDQARRPRSDRNPRLVHAGLVAAHVDDEFELVAPLVISRDREGVACANRRPRVAGRP